MRSVSASFSAAIAEGSVRICEIYDFDLTDGNTYRYTDHDQNITWNAGGDTYSSVVGARGPITFNTDGQVDECEVNIANISGDLVDLAANNGLEGAVLTIKRIRWDASYAADEEIQLFKGTPDVGYNSSEMTLNFKSIFASLNINVPAHSYQEPCNYAVFDVNCGLTQSDYEYSGSATGGSQTTLIDTAAGTLYKVAFVSGDSSNPIERADSLAGSIGGGTATCVQIVYLTSSTGYIWYLDMSGTLFVDGETLTGGGNTVVISGSPAEDLEFYKNGEIEITSGDNSGQRRPIQQRSGSTVSVKWPFVNSIESSDDYKLYPACDGRTTTCANQFGNDTEWDGYPYVPRIEETIF